MNLQVKFTVGLIVIAMFFLMCIPMYKRCKSIALGTSRIVACSDPNGCPVSQEEKNADQAATPAQ